MNILFIGGTRFIGLATVVRLVARGHRILVFHRGEHRGQLPESVEILHGARADLVGFKPKFRAFQPDVIVDMIASKALDASVVIEAFADLCPRCVVISSCDVYRSRDRLWRVESGPPDEAAAIESAPQRRVLYPYRALATGPDDRLYTYDKIPVEETFTTQNRIEWTILRLPAVYGPNDYQHRVGEYLTRMDRGDSRIALGESHAAWRWSRGYVDNVADAIIGAVENEQSAGRVYNVSEPALPLVDWVRAIARVAEWHGEISVLPLEQLSEAERKDAVEYDYQHHWEIDSGRIRRELGHIDAVSLDEGIRRTIEWERRNPSSAGS